MSFKPKAPQHNENTERTPFVAIVPEDGLQAVQIGLLVNLGQHEKFPKFAKDNAGKREQDENGEDKVIWPKTGKNLEQRVAAYVDLLTQTHDYGEEIGMKNIRLPLHQVVRGMSEGMNFTTVAPRDPNGNYIKGKPWTLAPASAWCKIAAVVKGEDGKYVSDTMLRADYKNPDHNNIQMLLGKPFMFNVEVKTTEKDGNTYVNTKLKNAVPLMKGMAVEPALIPAVSINFDDTDLLEVKEELGGACKFDLLRQADLRKIVLAVDYPGSAMQAAVQERMDESELISKAKEIAAKIVETDRDLNEIKAKYPNGNPSGEAPAQEAASKPAAAKPVKAPAKEQPKPTEDVSEDSDCPF